MEVARRQFKVSLKRIDGSLSVGNLFYCYFLGKSKIETKTIKGKSLAPTNSNRDIEMANEIKSSKETIETVPSHTDKVKQVETRFRPLK